MLICSWKSPQPLPPRRTISPWARISCWTGISPASYVDKRPSTDFFFQIAICSPIPNSPRSECSYRPETSTPARIASKPSGESDFVTAPPQSIEISITDPWPGRYCQLSIDPRTHPLQELLDPLLTSSTYHFGFESSIKLFTGKKRRYSTCDWSRVLFTSAG